MKSLILLLSLTYSSFSFANTVLIGCNEQKLLCPPDRECIWVTAMGQAGDVQLVKDGVGTGYEIWKGSFSGLVYGKFPFEVIISQKIDLQSLEKVNYLNIKLEVDDAEIITSGITRASAKYRKDEVGVGFICTTDIEPAPEAY